MAPHPRLCLLTIIIVFVYSTTLCETEEAVNHGNSIAEMTQAHQRWSRAFIKFGNAALKAILSKAKEVPTQSKAYRKFVKQGGIKEAQKDLDSMHPTILNQNEWHVKAVLDDGTLVKMEKYDNTNSHLPTLFIADREKARAIRIIYINKPLNDIY